MIETDAIDACIDTVECDYDSSIIVKQARGELNSLRNERDAWRQCAIRYAKGCPTQGDVILVGLAILNDSI